MSASSSRIKRLHFFPLWPGSLSISLSLSLSVSFFLSLYLPVIAPAELTTIKQQPNFNVVTIAAKQLQLPSRRCSASSKGKRHLANLISTFPYFGGVKGEWNNFGSVNSITGSRQEMRVSGFLAVYASTFHVLWFSTFLYFWFCSALVFFFCCCCCCCCLITRYLIVFIDSIHQFLMKRRREESISNVSPLAAGCSQLFHPWILALLIATFPISFIDMNY